ncbi:Uncharacterized protein GBIM_00476 [Gryllus bimaculatus]|nr:Uncharacterized protein GBIM_00476 [Gryllus bimaculatus]
MDTLQSHLGAESGLQLLSRLETRPSLIDLDNVIFESGLLPNEIVEINGDVSSGKTLLVTQFLAKCLLPKSYCGIDIGGLNAGAVIIDTDHHFQVLKLVTIMEAYIARSSNSLVDANTVESIIKDALDNLTILHCYDGVQLLITFHGLENILSCNRNISLLVLDSVSAFYWQNTLNNNGIRKMDLYLKKILISLQKHIHEFKVSVIYTKPLYFQSKVHNDSNVIGKYGKISRQIKLQKVLNSVNLFYAHICDNSNRKVLSYEIGNDGFHWHVAQEHK